MINLKSKNVKCVEIDCFDETDPYMDYTLNVEFKDGTSIIIWCDEDGDIAYYTEGEDFENKKNLWEDDGCVLGDKAYEKIDHVNEKYKQLRTKKRELLQGE